MEAIVQTLIVWIAANSQYSSERVATPEVIFMTSHEITAEYYSEQSALIPTGGIDDRIWALYDSTSEHGKIYLRWDDSESELENASAQAEVQNDPLRLVASVKSGLNSEPRSRRKSYEELFDENPILTERLLHELVHHLQFQSGATDSYLCPAQGELEAYRLGGLYFKQRYIEDPMPNRRFWAHVYSRC